MAKDKVCHSCKARKAKLFTCRVCGRRVCEHFCSNKVPGYVATCGKCRR